MRRLITVLLAFILAGCYPSGAEIPIDVARPDKVPPRKKGQLIEQALRIALYVDTAGSDINGVLEAAALYSIQPGENENTVPPIQGEGTEQTRVAYFDYVILSGGKLRMGKYSAYLELTDELQRILAQYDKFIRPLHKKGIKVLLGVSGGEDDGISFGCLPGKYDTQFIDDYHRYFVDSNNTPLSADEFLAQPGVATDINIIFKRRVKNKEFFGQSAFAIQVTDTCKYYRLDGVEFWDKGEIPATGPSPYPVLNREFNNGEKVVHVNNREEEVYNWIKGGGNFSDLLSYITIYLGTDATFQGELRGDIYKYPILVRESKYAEWLNKEVPRFAFCDLMLAMTYYVGNTRDKFGYDDTKTVNPLMKDWLEDTRYSPIIIDLSKYPTVNDPQLQEYSEALGRWDRAGDGSLVYQHACPYGLVYYDNLGGHSADQLEKLTVTSRELFDADVKYGPW
jgi:hypothetical protein